MGKKKTKVVIVMGSHWAAIKGGAQYQADCLARELAGHGDFDVTYLARFTSELDGTENYTVQPIGGPRFLRGKGFYWDTTWLLRRLQELQPDIIYQQEVNFFTGVCSYFARKNKKRFLFHIASDYDVIPLREHEVSLYCGIGFVEKIVGEVGLKNADAIIAQTKKQDELLFRNYGIRSSCVVRNFHPSPNENIVKKKGKLRVIWVANFKPVKRPENFVRLARELKSLRNVEFLMIGRDGGSKLYGQLHKSIREIENLTYLGEKTIDEVNQILAKADLFVNTSLIEGLPNTFIQSWMREVPVVTENVQVDDALDGKTAGICGGSFEGMRDAVETLLNDDEKRLQLARNSRSFALDNFSMRNVDQIIELMR